jgi:hypothetical protein
MGSLKLAVILLRANCAGDDRRQAACLQITDICGVVAHPAKNPRWISHGGGIFRILFRGVAIRVLDQRPMDFSELILLSSPETLVIPDEGAKA